MSEALRRWLRADAVFVWKRRSGARAEEAHCIVWHGMEFFLTERWDGL
ncbi:hypothetical protein [Beijerinckia mobilis]|nr:hypothetical protein [Beijerinckia mobilis]